jgi:glycosyltransferase involved in cell wall biosynthesis
MPDRFQEPATDVCFDGRLALQDLVLPLYRRTIYERLEPRINGGLGVFTGISGETHGVVVSDDLAVAENQRVLNRHYIGGPAEFIWQPGFVKWLDSFKPDVMIASGNPRIVSTYRAIRWARRNKVPVLGWGLGTLMMGSRLSSARNLTRRWFFQSFDGILAYSSKAKEQYASCGVREDRIYVVHNAISPRPTHDAPKRHDSFVDGGRLLFVGRLYPGKRLDLLFKAVSSLPDSMRPSIEIVGDGPTLEDLRCEADRHLPGRVHFTGALYGEELAEAFRRADLFVLPGMGGLAIQEAMSWALPVIAAEGDGTQFDLVREGNGWLMEPGDVGSLRSALMEALTDCPRLREMGLESYRIVCEELNLDRMIDEMVEAVCTIHKVM